MKDWQLRVVQERQELESKINKLNIFLDTPNNHLTVEEVGDLFKQRNAMCEYCDILFVRISKFKNV